MNQIIKRDFYLNKLIDRKNNGLIKVITGVRRCGKSYLLNTLFYDYLVSSGVPKDHIISFAFDSADDLSLIGESLINLEKEKRKVNPEKFMIYVHEKTKEEGQYFLLLDEIQLLDCFESVLNGYLYKKNMDVYVTGSNAKFLSKDIITEFSGRGDEIRMFPLSFAEFMSIYPGNKYEGLAEYMLYGGIPLVVMKKNEQDKADVLKNLFDEIYISDIIKRHGIKNKSELEDLLNILSSAVGSLTNPEKLKNTFHSKLNSKISGRTIKNYIDYLEDSFLIERADRYDIKGKSYIDSPQKYYFSDMGLRNARINFRQMEKTHTMENVIYNELIMRGFSVDVGIVSINEKIEKNEENNNDKNNAKSGYIRKQLEIDFICNMGYKRYYIQSAYSLPDAEKTNQEIRPFKGVNDSFKKIIVTGDITPLHYTEEGVMIINIYDFLLNPQSIDK